MLKVENLCVTFENHVVLDDVTFHVDDSEVVAIQGPSGSGKSTLLRAIAGLLIPDSGTVLVNESDITSVPTYKRNIGMVFQDNQLFPHMNVTSNIEFGLRMQGISKELRKARVSEMLSLVDLEGFENRAIADLSGGEAKRIALARSIAPSPSILLLDEPLSGLDRTLHDELASELKKLLFSNKITTLLVTHDREEAETIASRTINFE